MNSDQHHTGPGQLDGPLRQGQCLGTTAGRRVMMSQRETSGMHQAHTHTVYTADPGGHPCWPPVVLHCPRFKLIKGVYSMGPFEVAL